VPAARLGDRRGAGKGVGTLAPPPPRRQGRGAPAARLRPRLRLARQGNGRQNGRWVQSSGELRMLRNRT
jgi:hypothetical protein